MLVPNIVGPIEIGIETVAALAAEEKRLRATIVAGLVPTARTGLTGVSWVNLDDRHPACLGLVAEEVENVNPDLVVHDKDDKPYSVRYDQVNAMLLNEFLKEHRKVEELEAALGAVNERLKEQDVKIEKMNAQIEIGKPIARIASDN